MDMIINAKTSAIVRQLALYVARRAFRTWARDQGYRLRDISAGTVDRAALAWLAQHPEAYELAAEKVRQSPKLRAMAEREARQRERQRRARQSNILTDARAKARCSTTTIPVQISGAK